MAQDQAGQAAAQQRRLRRSVIAAALAILLAVPFLIVGGFTLTTRTTFMRMEAEAGPMRGVEARYDAFQHGYASGVMAVLFGDHLAALTGHAVELVEQNSCIEREHDLINNREGRALALRLYRDDRPGWRRHLAGVLFEELRRPGTAFSVRRNRDPRILALCASD